MANPLLLFVLQPIETSQVFDENPLPTTQADLQLAVDMMNVYEGRVPIESFPSEYQEKIKNFYRFSGTYANWRYPTCAKRTHDTIDLI